MDSKTRSAKDFASAVFTRDKMREYLSKAAFNSLVELIDGGGKLTREIADQVAHAMKEWALDNGATHFTHWFQPMRGLTAEKHDSFLTLEGGVAIDRFSGSQLIQSEPDASSFPSGGMRSTFEARGYTAWDPGSPVFIAWGTKKGTLVIPSVYLSWTGEVLDMKTQVLRSSEVVERLAYQMLKKFGNRTVRSVKVTTGPEQEYFLIAKKYFDARADLLLTGRTLLGRPSPRHQQFEDHYFGAIDPQVLAFMEDFDEALHERGIAYKTRHNEVAPHQYELAPSFVEGNLAVDQNLQLMDVMKLVAEKHGFAVLLHEKPFAGINGSGKHLNWSMMDSDGNNLFEPGAAPKRNVQFLVFLSAMLIGVNQFSGLLRAAVADAGNDHRLGANEAPPAIMSVYLGGYIKEVLDAIAEGKDIADVEKASLDIRAKHVPGVELDTTDRNRTSPVAFTGNKFEFRAVGSSQNIAEPMTVINLVMAYGMERMLEKIDKFQKQYKKPRDAALAAVRDAVRETERIRFEGNNYDGAWHEEAARRGLPAAKNTPEALRTYEQKEVTDLYVHFGVLRHKEVEAKVEIRREQYYKTKILELDVLEKLVKTNVLPALMKQLHLFGSTSANLPAGEGKAIIDAKIAYLSQLLVKIEKGVQAAATLIADLQASADLIANVDRLGNEGAALLTEIRVACDEVEREIAAEFWPLPKYTAMLHLK